MSLRPRPCGRWSLRDSYGFIATFLHAHARGYARRIHVPSKPAPLSIAHLLPNRSGHRLLTTKQSAGGTENSIVSEQQSVAFSPQSQVVRRGFHNYFVTHLPSSSLHPDSRSPSGLHHKLPRAAAAPHVPGPGASSPAAPPNINTNRDLTVVRIPLRSAKHHFGTAESRGQRPSNEDTNQAGTIDIPAFAKRGPISLVRSAKMSTSGEATPADSAFGDPQIFYFAVFDGHGGAQCSEFLREELHGYIEEAAAEFGLRSSLRTRDKRGRPHTPTPWVDDAEAGGKKQLDQVAMKTPEEVKRTSGSAVDGGDAAPGSQPEALEANVSRALRLQQELVEEYKQTVGGYFRRFSPPHFHVRRERDAPEPVVSIETVMTYAFLRADLDFITAQAEKPDPDDPYVNDEALNSDEILGQPHHMPPSGHGIGGRTRFKGGSTASVALISTPTPAPFWHPSANSTLLVAHVGDSRILLCETATGLAKPLTSDHHTSAPLESHRLRRYAASFVTDSFGDERIQGLANSRAFGDMGSKRLGVSAEPELTRTELGPAQYSFIVLVSDGVSGTIGDQEIVDIVKEAKTPEQGASSVVSYATEVSSDGDNATCQVVRLGGWERRSEGGLGSLGTKEMRDFRRDEALDPRRGRR